MHLMAYISEATSCAAEVGKDLSDIVAVAKRENLKRGITGVLFYHKEKFLQVVEGREEDLRQLMANIEKDSRHRNMHVLIDTKVESRGFAQWNMDSFHLDDDHIIDPVTFAALTLSFKESLVPRSDMLVLYYKTLLKKKKS